jgi:hypothetical protein
MSVVATGLPATPTHHAEASREGRKLGEGGWQVHLGAVFRTRGWPTYVSSAKGATFTVSPPQDGFATANLGRSPRS